VNGLNGWPDLIEHYGRQREFFYHAESLRNFARDNVPRARLKTCRPRFMPVSPT
jgi:hypothetical protein